MQNGNQELSSSSSGIECSFDEAINQNISMSPERILDANPSSSGNKSGKSKAELMYVLNGIVEEYINKPNKDVSKLKLDSELSVFYLFPFSLVKLKVIDAYDLQNLEKLGNLFNFLEFCSYR